MDGQTDRQKGTDRGREAGREGDIHTETKMVLTSCYRVRSGGGRGIGMGSGILLTFVYKQIDLVLTCQELIG